MFFTFLRSFSHFTVFKITKRQTCVLTGLYFALMSAIGIFSYKNRSYSRTLKITFSPIPFRFQNKNVWFHSAVHGNFTIPRPHFYDYRSWHSEIIGVTREFSGHIVHVYQYRVILKWLKKILNGCYCTIINIYIYRYCTWNQGCIL